MPIKELQAKTVQKLIDIESKEKYDPTLTLDNAIKRSYNTSRTLNEYIKKFPILSNFLKPSVEILEIGVGDGIALKEMVEQFQVNAIGTCINEQDKKDNVIKAFAYDLPFKNDSFDIVLSIHSITWEPNQKAAISEVIRVLKPGGTACINLYKFSEISKLWFGRHFWDGQNIADYTEKYEFNDADYLEHNVCEVTIKQVVSEVKTLSNAFFIILTK